MHALFLFTQYLLVAESLAAIAGLITWRKWKQSYLKWLVPYLLVISIMELSNHLLLYFDKTYEVSFVNQVVVPFEILFINWFFYKTLAGNKAKIVWIGTIIYVISWIFEKSIFDTRGYYFESLSYTMANLFILIYLILFFVELVNSERLLIFNKLTVFWITSGMLLFYLGTFPFFGLYNELAKDLNLFIPLAWGATALNYGMYLFFTIGILWGKPH